MSIHQSPRVVTDGLVFAYDMANTKKSFKGAPVTNQFNCPNPYDSNNNVSFIINGTGTFQRVYSGTYGGYTITPEDVVYRYNLGNGGCHYHGNSAAISAGQYVCYSVDYYISPDASDYLTNGTLIILENYGNSALSGGTGVSGDVTTKGKWQTIQGVSGPTGGSGTQAMFLYPGGCSGAGSYIASRGFILMKNPMFEFRSDVRYNPFVNGTRYTNNNLESTPSYPTWNQSASSASGGTLTFTSGSYNTKGTWDLYKTYSGLSTATNYTWSASVKKGTATNLIVTMNNTQDWNTGPANTFSEFSSTEWKRVSITGTTTSGSFNIHLGSSFNTGFSDTIQTGGTILIQDVRLQLTSSQTAIQDLVDQNTIAATSLTYASDGTFSFNGSNSLTISANPTSLDFNSGQTIILWMINKSTSAVRRNPYNQAYAGGGTITHEYDTGFNYYYGTGGGDNSPYTSLYSSFNLVQGERAMIALTRNTSTTSWYKNGVFSNSHGNPYGTIVTGTNAITIGNGYTTGFVGEIHSVQLYNRSLSPSEIAQNYSAFAGRYVGESPDIPADSGYALRAARPELPSGYYWIKNLRMPNALKMYVDMSGEGGGYDFYPMQGGGTSIGSTNGVHSGIALGLDLVYPRSKQHWIAMSNFVRNVLGSTGNEYFTTVYSVHRETSSGAGSRGGNYTGDIMRNPVFYGTGAPDWRVPDGGRWWLRDSTFSEPNGDYTAYNFLGGYTHPNPYTGQDIQFNDVTGQNYTTGGYYLLSTNTKP